VASQALAFWLTDILFFVRRRERNISNTAYSVRKEGAMKAAVGSNQKECQSALALRQGSSEFQILPF
jgi:hypothetical protein